MKRLALILALIITSSCTPLKDLTYLNGAQFDEPFPVAYSYDLKVQKDDLLSINITCEKPDLVAPFMQSAYGGATDITANRTENTFLVNSSGEIYFPILGKIAVEGLSHSEVSTKIEKLIIEGGYINELVVTVRLKNFKVVVLGDVSSPGVVEFQTDRVSIFDVIASTGDIEASGKKKAIKVVRENNGMRMIASVDITRADVFNSPYYYLKQNDIVYVEPNARSARQGELLNDDKWFNVGLSLVTSAASVLIGALLF